MTDELDSIYLDYCATTPVDPRVLDVMLPWLRWDFGNPSSTSHSFGRRAAEAVEKARDHVSVLGGCRPEEVVWTSGATEANNLALKGMAYTKKNSTAILITQSTEHKAILTPLESLMQDGFAGAIIGVDSSGSINLCHLSETIRPASLVTIMAANNETGVIFPLEEIASLCHSAGAVFHTDAAQAFGKMNLTQAPYDLMSLSSHKLYGPKGVGALVVRGPRILHMLRPLLEGGGQERGIRGGTLNVPGIVGFGEACRLAAIEMDAEGRRVQGLRNIFEEVLQQRVENVTINGGSVPRLPNVSNVGFPGVDAESLVMASGMAISTGSACTSSSIEPSHVLSAMNLPVEIQRGSIRVSLGRYTTLEDIQTAAAIISTAVLKLRELSTEW